MPSTPQTTPVTASYRVTGMTCDHCGPRDCLKDRVGGVVIREAGADALAGKGSP
jgi:hypothetical protein